KILFMLADEFEPPKQGCIDLIASFVVVRLDSDRVDHYCVEIDRCEDVGLVSFGVNGEVVDFRNMVFRQNGGKRSNTDFHHRMTCVVSLCCSFDALSVSWIHRLRKPAQHLYMRVAVNFDKGEPSLAPGDRDLKTDGRTILD